MEDRIRTINEKIDGTTHVYNDKLDRIGRRLAAANQLIQEAQDTKKELTELRLQELQSMSEHVDSWFKNEKESRDQQDTELELLIESRF
jgi:hypothetical protein